ncbi:Beta-lactamase-like protein [Penicillium expansum]|uniref:Beta-lactamase-like protein n=1 Tax=Penicillium expansum TaxID=27334 RepID=A0A0A2KZW4_PENEN|nr:Beta-lactamase-like protein [Penicillium expansum]KGO40068.1 Beta-lactamase-like protein [Penicillium expansum]KGO53168.1 Beta-lactamase-like protein [Penicillium expansum]KGO73319.1 Beta-lactamase-like protein [Penicillium expansum]
MLSILHASAFFLLFSSALSFTPCPLLGPAFPPFSLNGDDKTIASALKELTKKFDTLVATDTGTHGDVSPNTTFSIALFSSDSGDAENEPFFWQYHHTAPTLNKSAVGSYAADTDSIYGIGGLTEVFTVWSLLLTGDGDQIFDDPVTKYLPELGDNTREQDMIEKVRWNDVTVGQLSSHMSGIGRDYCSKDVTLQISSSEAGLPSHQAILMPCCDDGSKCDSNDFIRYLANQTRVAPAGGTPSYSNMAFQLLGYIVEKRTGKPFSKVLQHDIFDVLGMTETSIFAPDKTTAGIIPVSKEASGWLTHHKRDEASKSLFSSIKDLAIAGQAILNSTLLSKPQTNRWFKPVSHTSNPANSIGSPWVIYSAGSYPNTSMVDIYTVLSNEGNNESLYSSYLGLVPDFGVGFAILAADTEAPADLNAHADIIGDVVLEALMKTAIEQAAENFGGAYKASNINSSISVGYDSLPGLYIQEFVSNGTDFRATLAGIVGVEKQADLSIRLYPTQLVEDSGSGSRQAFRAVFQDITELADNDTPTCVSWLNLDKLQYGGRGLDEFIFSLDPSGQAVSVEIPALRVSLGKN